MSALSTSINLRQTVVGQYDKRQKRPEDSNQFLELTQFKSPFSHFLNEIRDMQKGAW